MNSTTKFESLCQDYKKAQTDFQQYQNDCQDFAESLWNRMVDYFKIPASQLSLYTVNTEGEYEVTSPPLFDALTLRADTYWEIGFGITVYETKNNFPQETIIIGLLIKRISYNHFAVKLIDHQEEFLTDSNSDKDFNKFFEYLYHLISNSYTSGLQTFLNKEITERHIGFKIGQK